MMDQSSTPPLVRVLGYIAAVLFGVVIVLQLLLAAGVLPVSMAWGGRQSELTPALRWSSIGAAVLLGAFAFVIARRSNILWESPPSLLIKVLSWMITLYMGLNTLGNFSSPSPGEKMLFGPINLVLLVACLGVSIIKPTGQSGEG